MMGSLTTIYGAVVSLVEFENVGYFILLCMLIGGSAAVTDVVVDGAMVV